MPQVVVGERVRNGLDKTKQQQLQQRQQQAAAISTKRQQAIGNSYSTRNGNGK